MAATSAAGNSRACSGLISPVTPSSSARPSISAGSGTCHSSACCSSTLLKANSEPPTISRLKKRLCGVSRPAILQQAGTRENIRPSCNWPINRPNSTGRHNTSVCRSA